MQIKELYSQVARLGFEDSLEDAKSFYHSANRALLQINALRPSIGAQTINHHPLPSLLGDSYFAPKEIFGEVEFATAEDVRSYYFEADGNGFFRIERLKEDGTSWEIARQDVLSVAEGERNFKPYRGDLSMSGEYPKGTYKIVFWGDFLFNVRRVALYGATYSNRDEDVPAYTPYSMYDMSVIAKDFLEFASPPVEESDIYGKKIDGYSIEGNNIVFPYDQTGTYRVLYHRKPIALEYKNDPTSDETVIDLDGELSSLMPILVASYILLEDEKEKAYYYMDLYRERAAYIVANRRNRDPIKIKNKYGW